MQDGEFERLPDDNWRGATHRHRRLVNELRHEPHVHAIKSLANFARKLDRVPGLKLM